MEVTQGLLTSKRATRRRKWQPSLPFLVGWRQGSNGGTWGVRACHTGGPLNPGLIGHLHESGPGVGSGDAMKIPVDRGVMRDKMAQVWNL